VPILVPMKHSDNDKKNSSISYPPIYEEGPNGFLARAAAAGFEDEIDALLKKYVLGSRSRANLRLAMDRYGMSGPGFTSAATEAQLAGKLVPGFYYRYVMLHCRIREAFVENKKGGSARR
jgi:hypothetical protein